MACPEYEASLEDFLSGELSGAQAKDLADHITGCAGCRTALDEAAVSARLLRIAAPIVGRAEDPGPGFARIVMARIRAEAQRTKQEKSMWQPLAAFAWRFALSATLALALLVTYAVKLRNQPGADLTVLRASETRDLISDMSGPPASRDEVLLMVAETNHGK